MADCVECEIKTDALYNDNRIPPLEEGACLCVGCAIEALQTRVEELSDEIRYAVGERTRLERIQRGDKS